MRTLDEVGRPFGVPAFDVSGSVKGSAAFAGITDAAGDRRWLQLLAYLPMEWLSRSAYVERALTAWLGLAEKCDPAYGEIGVGQGERSELETHLAGQYGIAVANIPHARQRLRGYGWLTVCPREVGDQLGGGAYFRSSNAYFRVVELGSGGYWLQATPTYAGYNLAAAERVHRTLAPALIPGRPIAGVGFGSRHRLVLEDAHPGQYQPPARGKRRSVSTKLPTFTLVATGEAQTATGSTEWGWQLLRDGVTCHGWGHTKPGGDHYIQILAALAVFQDAGRSVTDWIAEGGANGQPRYRAVLG
jgi:hypothetical protein